MAPVGAALALVGVVGPIQLLFASNVKAGLAATITLILMMLIAHDEQVMRSHRVGRNLMIAGVLVTALVILARVIFLGQTILSVV